MKTEKNNRLRGTVLFTVVAVMALLIIFLTGTLALATASNNRAHKSYSSSQASYTAKTAITGFTQALEASEEVRNKIVNLGIDGNTNIIHPTITFNEGGSQDRAMGIIGYWDEHGVWHDNQITVERENLTNPSDPQHPEKTEWVYDWKETQKWVQIERVKITATARVGREESTVTAYLTKMPGEPEETETVPTTPRTNTGGIKGLNTVGDGVFQNGGRYTGGMGIGLSGDGENNGKKYSYVLDNSCELNTTLTFINGDVSFKTGTFGINVDQAADVPVSQTVITGSLLLPNNELVELNYKMNHDFTQKQIPYLYVNDAFTTQTSDGNLITYKGENKQMSQHINRPASPYNLFVGTMATGNNNYLVHADMYFMDRYQPGEFYDVTNPTTNGKVEKGNNYFGGNNQNNSQLYRWAYDTVNQTASQNYSEGGNIFCNGRLHLGGGEYDGDVRVTENCIITGPATVHIHGDLVVGGKLEVTGTLIVDGHVYCDNIEGYSVDGNNNNNNNNATPTYTRVKNIYDGPPEYEPKEGEEPNWDDIKVLTCPKREWFVWNPESHYADDGTGQYRPSDINGNVVEGEMKRSFYKYKDNYCPGIIMCRNGGDYTYYFPDEKENATADSYEVIKNVDDIIKALLEGQTKMSDPETASVVEKWIDLANVEESSDYNRPAYPCEFERVTNSANETVYRETSIKCDYEKVMIDPLTGNIVPNAVVPHYNKADANGQQINPPVNVNANQYTYYINGIEVDKETFDAPRQEPQAPIDDADKIKSFGAYGKSAYPEDMTREKIYGYYTVEGDEGVTGMFNSAPDGTKIIKTLQEVRQDLGFKKTGVDYPRTLKEAAGEAIAATLENADETSKETAIALDGNYKKNASNTSIWGHQTDKDIITGNCVITGSISGSDMSVNDGNDGKIKAKDRPYKRAVYTNGNYSKDEEYKPKVIEINPLGKEIWVVLDNVTMGNEAEIHVDFTNPANNKQEGKVKFFIKGTVKIDKGSIINKKIASGTDDSNPLEINMVNHTNTDFRMEFYGENDSELFLSNNCTLTGTFKCPYTDFQSLVVGKYRVHYIDEYGVDWTKKPQGVQTRGGDQVQGCPCIIGNALFDDVLETQNDFGLYYTESGQIGDQGNTDEQGNQDVTVRTIRAATGEKWFFEFYSAT